jgi:murein DD-endopeptidase MepM/ murein hydrolase activator NlpD
MKRNDIHRWSASAVCFLVATLFASYEGYNYFYAEEAPEAEPIVMAAAVDTPAAPVEEEELVKTVKLKVGAGDTLASILGRQKVSHREIHLLTSSIREHYKPKDLKPGLEVEVTLAKSHKDDRNPTIQDLKVRPAIDYEVIAIRNDEGQFECEKREIRLIEERRWAEAKIEGSLSEAANRFGIPHQIMTNMISAFSHSIDFQRSIKDGDTFGLMYTVFTDPQTGRQRPGNLLYATITADGKPKHIYRYKPKGGVMGFYNEKGESLRSSKGLMRTPVDGARISSRFGMRMHPVQGYHKHHKGVDFAVPHGTPIMAAGDGVIERAGSYGAYGNYVCIRHSNGYKTAYAHLSKYHKNARHGMPVKQGQIIGYVGATGRTTGAHLHYEVLIGNKQVNPLSVKTLPAAMLSGKQKDEFFRTKKDFDLQYAQLKQGTALAVAQTDTDRG